MLPKSPLRRPRHIFYGYWVLLAGSLLQVIGGGLHFFNMSVLFLPLSRDLGISRAQTSLVVSLSRAEAIFEGPIVGWLIDRLGPRRMIIFGSMLAGIGYLLFSQIHSFIAFLLVFLTILSMGQRAGLGAPVQAALNNWFVRRRAFVMSTVFAMFTVGGSILPVVLSFAVNNLGWRTAVVLVGIGLLTVAPLLSLPIRTRPEDMGLRPDGETEQGVVPLGRRGTALGVDFTLGQALRSPPFWLMVLAVNFRLAAFSGLTIHFIPIMAWKGVSEEYAAVLLGFWNLVGLPVNLVMGRLADRWSKTKIAALAFTLGVLNVLLLLYAQATWQLWLYAAMLAPVLGATPVIAAIVGDFYGRRNFATISGFFGAFSVVGTTLGAIFAGAVFDRTESYSFALVVFVVCFGMAALIMALLRPPPVSQSR